MVHAYNLRACVGMCEGFVKPDGVINVCSNHKGNNYKVKFVTNPHGTNGP